MSLRESRKPSFTIINFFDEIAWILNAYTDTQWERERARKHSHMLINDMTVELITSPIDDKRMCLPYLTGHYH